MFFSTSITNNTPLDIPTETQRHLHVLKHLNGTSNDTMPVSALDLHRYENQNAAAPMQTYTSTISSLFAFPSFLSRSQARDIFAMSHIIILYTEMIRACLGPLLLPAKKGARSLDEDDGGPQNPINRPGASFWPARGRVRRIM